MSKQLSITLSDHVYNTYLKDIGVNRSQFIEKLIQLGAESEADGAENTKNRLIKANQTIIAKDMEIEELNRKIDRMNQQIGKLKKDIEDRKNVSEVVHFG